MTFIAFITFFIAFAFITFIAIAAWAVERCGGGSKVVLEPGKQTAERFGLRVFLGIDRRRSFREEA